MCVTFCTVMQLLIMGIVIIFHWGCADLQGNVQFVNGSLLSKRMSNYWHGKYIKY